MLEQYAALCVNMLHWVTVSRAQLPDMHGLKQSSAIIECSSCPVLLQARFPVVSLRVMQSIWHGPCPESGSTVGQACRCELTWRPSRALRSRWLRCTCVRHVAQALCKEEAKQARLAFCTLARLSLLTTINSFQLAKALHTYRGHQTWIKITLTVNVC